ncbi:MAG: amino acid permease [Conexibacter sp.]|nr:amino acid permease [Conexibacter sp.]
MAANVDAAATASSDEQRLAELGYKQELNRSWSGFQNFAISFTIISVLAGCFTTYYQAWNNGGPVAISWGWPIISAFILVIAFCMSELVSAYPTAGGIYWWASKLGGPAWGWFTGWFNLLGLIAIVASVDYFAGQFLGVILGLYNVDILGLNFGDSLHGLRETFILFALILSLHVLINIRGSHLVAMFNGISVWWHVLGVAVIVVVLIFAPSKHASVDFVFTHTINNSGFSHGMLWFYVLPLGFLLTQYTITGFDASAHISEETHGAAESAPKGVWRSVFYSAVIGYVVLLAITFAASNEKAVTEGGGAVFAVFESSMGSGWVKLILIIAVIGQLFCGMSCMTSASRMMYAFSRDGAVPGWRIWSRVNDNGVPFNAVIAVAFLALILTLPALKGNKDGLTVAFTAVVSIGVIGLYIAYAIPIYLRWRMGSAFVAGPWTLGNKYKWMNPLAVVEVIVVVIVYFNLPFASAGVPFKKGFDWSLFNYTPLVTGGVFIAVGIWWLAVARHTFTGPRQTLTELEAELEQGGPADPPGGATAAPAGA